MKNITIDVHHGPPLKTMQTKLQKYNKYNETAQIDEKFFWFHSDKLSFIIDAAKT